MKFFKKLIEFKNKIMDPFYDIDDEDWEQVDAWNEVVYDRNDLKISDKESREAYVRGCLEQIAEASKEVDGLKTEYDIVTSRLKDMEEVEALPEEEKEIITGLAKRLSTLKGEKTTYADRKHHLPDTEYRRIEAIEDLVAEGCEKLGETEKYQKLIKKDLRRLENEKQAYFIRRDDLQNIINDSRTMAIICTVAVAVCILLMLVLQYGFGMNTKIGYLATVLAGAIGITMIFVRYMDSSKELKDLERGITRLIQLQNTVKIRYVNNTHLLDYQCVKYQTESASKLKKSYELYLLEKEEREKIKKSAVELTDCEENLLHELRRFQIREPELWLHQTEAILDHREMVEIRHKLIIQRQALRRRIDYNRDIVANNAQKEIKDLVEKNPKYASEILSIVSEYEKAYT